MSVDTPNLPDQPANTAAGEAVESGRVAAKPRRRARNSSRRPEGSQAPAAQRVRRQAAQAVSEAASTTALVVNGTIPSRIVRRGLRKVKAQARRRDLVGEATYRTLDLVHQGLGTAVRSLSRLQAASQPPVRPARDGSTEPRPASLQLGPSAGKRPRLPVRPRPLQPDQSGDRPAPPLARPRAARGPASRPDQHVGERRCVFAPSAAPSDPAIQ